MSAAQSIQAAVSLGPNSAFELKNVDLDDLCEDEIRVRIDACGICHTDAWARSIPKQPAVFGHEGTGVIEAIGAKVADVAVGDTVILSYPFCGDCRACHAGQHYRCDDIIALKFDGHRADGSQPITLNGEPLYSAFFQQSSFATQAIAPARAAVKVDPRIPAEIRAAMPCGIQTGAGSVLNTLRVAPGDSLIVAGAGAVGLSAVMAGALASASPLVAMDINAARLNVALELGATHVIDSSKENAEEIIKKLLPGGTDHFLDTTTSAQVWTVGIGALAMGGRFGFVGAPEGEQYRPDLDHLLARAATMHGIIQGSSIPRDFIPKLLRWYETGRLPVDKLVETYPLVSINQAFADSKSGDAIKAVLLMD